MIEAYNKEDELEKFINIFLYRITITLLI